MKKIKKILFLFLPFVIFGCAYSVSGRSLSHLNTITVQTFANSTDEDWLDEDLLTYFSTQFNSNSDLKTQTKNADCILKGEILTYTDEVYKYDSDDNIESYHIMMSFKVTFYDLVKNKTLYSVSSKSYNITYAISDKTDINVDVTITKAQNNNRDKYEQIIKPKIFKELFDEINNSTFESW